MIEFFYVLTGVDVFFEKQLFFSLSVVVIYYHLSKLSVGQTPRLCNLPSKSYSYNINVPYTGGNDLVKESGKPFNGMPIKF